MLMLQVIINTVHVIIIVQCMIVLMLTSQIIDENTSIFKHNNHTTETSQTGYVQCMVNATVHKTM